MDRELTVDQLRAELAELPGHWRVSPIVGGTVGAGLELRVVQGAPDVAEPIVLFGELPGPLVPPVVPPEWVTG